MSSVPSAWHTADPTRLGPGATLVVRELYKTYQDPSRPGERLLALRGVSVTVEPGEFVCLLGPSGCGKSTLLRIVAGLDRADRGEVLLDGRRVERPGWERAMVFQNYGLLPWRTVLGNVELGLEIQGVPVQQRRPRALKEIARLGLAGFERHYPHQLSGGMQQRVGLARALVKNPSLLLMDEPFAAVDMHTREYLQEVLLGIWHEERRTVLFVTHSVEEAVFLGDRVVVMSARPGRVYADVHVALPRPRDKSLKGAPGFAALSAQVRDLLYEATGGRTVGRTATT